MTLDDMLSAAARAPALLDDRYHRLTLADALEEAARHGEAALLRKEGTVIVIPAHEHRLRPEAAPWHRAAMELPSARCTLAEWLQSGPTVVAANPGLQRVEVTDRAPRRQHPADSKRHVYQWHAIDDPPPAGLRAEDVEGPCLIRAAFELPPPGVQVRTYGTAREAHDDLSLNCLRWARVPF